MKLESTHSKTSKSVGALMLFLVLFCSNITEALARSKPIGIVGIVPDYYDPKAGDDSDKNIMNNNKFFGLKEDYTKKLEAACVPRGIAVMIIPETKNERTLEMYEDLIDGVLFVGNRYDIDPQLYDEKNRHKDLVKISKYRTNFEMNLFERLMANGKSMMGICGGAQMMNVASGGSLYQDLPQEMPSKVKHRQTKKGTSPSHLVRFNTASATFKQISTRVIKNKKFKEKPEVRVNSFHHQAVKNLATGFEPVAFSEDGVNEAYEYINKDQLLLGIQWHPEYGASGEIDSALFDIFCENVETQIRNREKKGS